MSLRAVAEKITAYIISIDQRRRAGTPNSAPICVSSKTRPAATAERASSNDSRIPGCDSHYRASWIDSHSAPLISTAATILPW